jgi:predicted DNA-binding transcriptional regulator YafY
LSSPYPRRRIAPLSIVVYDHQLYLIARDRRRHHPYRFSRIIDFAMTSLSFRYPKAADYDLRALFAESFGIFITPAKIERARIRLAARWATFARSHRWHALQRIVEEANGIGVELARIPCQRAAGGLFASHHALGFLLDCYAHCIQQRTDIRSGDLSGTFGNL